MIGNEHLDAIERLHRLREAGALTDAEFAAAKARVFEGQSSMPPVPAQGPAFVADRDTAVRERSTAPYWIGGGAATLAVLVGGAWLLSSGPLVPAINAPPHRIAKAGHIRPVQDSTPSPMPTDVAIAPAFAPAASPPVARLVPQAHFASVAERTPRIKGVPSLDGGYVYRIVPRSAMTGEVVQVRVADGRTRNVIDGNSVEVIRSGPYRGYLLVERYRYIQETGAQVPTDVVRPDGNLFTTLPGCEGGGDSDDEQQCVEAWLRARGWRAS